MVSCPMIGSIPIHLLSGALKMYLETTNPTTGAKAQKDRHGSVVIGISIPHWNSNGHWRHAKNCNLLCLEL